MQLSVAIQVRGTSIDGKVFEIEALGSPGRAVGAVDFQPGRDCRFTIDNTIPDFHIEHGEPALTGASLLVNISISHKGKMIALIAIQCLIYTIFLTVRDAQAVAEGSASKSEPPTVIYLSVGC